MDSIFGIHTDALLMREKRAQVLAMNLVNASTPHYKAKDIDFNKLLAEKMQGNESDFRLTRSNPNHLSTMQTEESEGLIEREATQPSEDGNTVDEDVEQNIYTQNSLQYLAGLSFISDKIQTINLALRGE